MGENKPKPSKSTTQDLSRGSSATQASHSKNSARSKDSVSNNLLQARVLTAPGSVAGDYMGLGVPKPRTGQAAVDLVYRAGITNKNGTLKARFR